MAHRVAILGFGFSGLMVTRQLVSRMGEGSEIYIIAPEANGRGLAYSTQDVQHLLNVPAGRMGAEPDQIDGFFQWLESAAGAVSRQRCKHAAYGPSDFVPRMIYGDYLETIWQQTQDMAAQKRVQLKLVPTRATAVKAGVPLSILTERGDAIAVDHAVLATGHETKPILQHVPPEHVIQNPWAPDAFAQVIQARAPIALMGVGLTAVDVVMHLRGLGYTGEIIAFSRHGLLPKAHVLPLAPYHFEASILLAQKTLRRVMRVVRDALQQHAAHGGDWRAVVDALRPHTQALWKQWTTREQQRFLRWLLPVWNVHRHRMAPEIAARMDAEIAAGTLRVLAHKRPELRMDGAALTLRVGADEVQVSCIINCTGPQMELQKSSSTLVRQALAEGVIEPHATGLGLAVDPLCRVWGSAHPYLYAMGPLMTGQLLESTAVPELRGQAVLVAQGIVANN